LFANNGFRLSSDPLFVAALVTLSFGALGAFLLRSSPASAQTRAPDLTLLESELQTLSERLHQVAAELDIEIQLAVRRTGGTDAGAIHRSRDGVPTVVLGVPARYIHSHASLLHWQDYLAARRLALEVVVRLDGPTVEELTRF